ncbi:MAG: TVP38/TMEM64 family protein [Rhodospirillales bacterium]|nr:TVP38/TMEM64 family protein [Rhodospirillales bacterium]
MTEASSGGAIDPKQGRGIWRWAPLIALAVGGALFFLSGLHENLSFEALRDNRAELLAWVHANAVLAPLTFIMIYAVATVFVPPSGTVMTVVGGFVFGAVLATSCVVVGATVGATVLFLVAKFSIGDFLRKRAGPGIRRMEEGFRENELSYMLVLRLVPLFPFWLVNLAPAFLGVKVRTFVVGTFIGIIPGTAVYAVFGAGLGSIFDSNEKISLAGVVTPGVLAGLIGLALLSLVPIAYKRAKQKRLK